MFPKRYIDDLMLMYPDLQSAAKLSASYAATSSSASNASSNKLSNKEDENQFMSLVDVEPARDEASPQMGVFTNEESKSQSSLNQTNKQTDPLKKRELPGQSNSSSIVSKVT